MSFGMPHTIIGSMQGRSPVTSLVTSPVTCPCDDTTTPRSRQPPRRTTCATRDGSRDDRRGLAPPFYCDTRHNKQCHKHGPQTTVMAHKQLAVAVTITSPPLCHITDRSLFWLWASRPKTSSACTPPAPARCASRCRAAYPNASSLPLILTPERPELAHAGCLRASTDH